MNKTTLFSPYPRKHSHHTCNQMQKSTRWKNLLNNCKNLEEGLKWWDAQTTKETVHLSHYYDDKLLITLNDTWSLYGWSIWLENQKQVPSEIALIHISEHADMKPCNIKINNNWIDIFTYKNINMISPNTIAQAIRSNAIGFSNILTPLVYFFPNINIFHLHQSAEKNGIYILKKIKNPIIDLRMRVQFTSANWYEEVKGIHNLYLHSPDHEWLLNKIDKKKLILLHVNMDYFANPTNGHPFGKYSSNGFDIDIPKQKLEMIKIFNTLAKAELLHEIKHISIALSPGFYPAKYWKEGLYCMKEIISDFLPSFAKSFITCMRR